METKADYLFESSWEVCNKVGGIFTVVKSKAAVMKEFYPNYFLIGPYFADKAEGDVDWKDPPEFLKQAFHEMEQLGVKCHFGNWIIDGEPSVILLELTDYHENVDYIKKWLWENYQVDSLRAGWDFNEPLLWSWAVGILMDKLSNLDKVVLHCHEWLAGSSILYLKTRDTKVKTVFTTHATMLGRTIAGNGMNIYDMLETLKPDEQARSLRVEEKHTMEKACAHSADVFTTVSEITGIEAEKILGKKPDVLLNNGLQADKFPTIEETTLMHIRYRDRIREFLSYFFFPYYTFELERNIIFYIVGRYEFKNKGLDILIQALKKLNEEYKNKDTNRTFTVFFWIPMSHTGIREDVMENKNYYSHIKSTLEAYSDRILNNVLHDLISQKCSIEESVFTSSYVQGLKKHLKHFKREGNPPISSHKILNQDKDAIVTALKAAGLDNKEEDKVKVVVYPVYLDGNDNLLNLSYQEALAGGHLGIYPSYYEPWGYTPLESMSLSVPAVTTDLAGFGRFIKPHLMKKNPGAFVIDRWGKNNEQEVDELYNVLSKFGSFDHAERVQNKINAKSMSVLADWKHFAKNYVEAHNRALD